MKGLTLKKFHLKIFPMRENFRKGGMFILQIILTALASAAVAFLQHWIEAHGVPAGPLLEPGKTAAIGAGISTVHLTGRMNKSFNV